MPTMALKPTILFPILLVALIYFARPAQAFGAGNIASTSKIEGQNWRHGDIEDMLATVACLKGHKWKSNMIKVCPYCDAAAIMVTDLTCSVCTLATGYAITHK